MFYVATHLKEAKHLAVLIDLPATLICQIQGIRIYSASQSVLSHSHRASHLLLFQLNV